MKERIAVDLEHAGQRLDSFLAAREGAPSRSQLKLAIEQGRVTVDGLPRKAGYALRDGEWIELELVVPTVPELRPEAIALDILFEDESLIVLDKPSGLVVHPAPGHAEGTLVNALLHHCGASLDGVGAVERPGIVHRLDRETSGVLVVAKTVAAHAALARQFAEHSSLRRYLALCLAPALPAQGLIDTCYGRHPQDRKRFTSRVERGRRAITEYEVLERFEAGAALVRCRLRTGRTHQVRVHLSEHGAPLFGDTVYGSRASARGTLIDRVALHAAELGFTHPSDGRAMHFERPPPADFARALEALRGGASWRTLP